MQARGFIPFRMLIVSLGVLAAAPDVALADNYQVDPIHSSLVFRVKHFNVGYIHGRFDSLSGSFRYDPQAPDKASFEIQAKADSIDTNNAARDNHLKGPDFFNVKQFPGITFKSKQVKPLGDNALEVTGDLTLRGETHPVTVKMEYVGSGKDPRGAYRSGFETTFTIKRSDYGMKFMLGGIGDEVRITAAFEGVRQ